MNLNKKINITVQPFNAAKIKARIQKIQQIKNKKNNF
jgi:hypothetical protein